METKFQSEEEFLKAYNPNEFERLSLTTDILVFSVSDGEKENYRKLKEKRFSVLLVKRNNYPYKDKWNIPGGFVGINETIDDATKRVLAKETNLHNIYMEQLYTFSDINRDPRMRVISTAYMALVDKNQLEDKLSENASWFHLTKKETKTTLTVIFKNEEESFVIKYKKKVRDKTSMEYSYEVIENDHLAFDHALVIAKGLDRIKNKIEYTNIAFNLMPEEFTLGELQQVYEVILEKKLLDPAFRRMIADRVEKTGNYKTGEGHRPSALFRLKPEA